MHVGGGLQLCVVTGNVEIVRASVTCPSRQGNQHGGRSDRVLTCEEPIGQPELIVLPDTWYPLPLNSPRHTSNACTVVYSATGKRNFVTRCRRAQPRQGSGQISKFSRHHCCCPSMCQPEADSRASTQASLMHGALTWFSGQDS